MRIIATMINIVENILSFSMAKNFMKKSFIILILSFLPVPLYRLLLLKSKKACYLVPYSKYLFVVHGKNYSKNNKKKCSPNNSHFQRCQSVF